MKFDEALARYCADVQPTSQVLCNIHSSWPVFTSFCRAHGLRALEEVQAQHIDAFHQRLLWEPNSKGQLYKPHSVAQCLCRIRQILRWAHHSGHLDCDPTANLLLPRQARPAKALLTWEELEALRNAPDRRRPTGLRDAALFAMVAETDLGLIGCLELVLRQEKCLDLEQPTRALLDAYLKDGRPALQRDERETALFLGRYGWPLGRRAAAFQLAKSAHAIGIYHHVNALTLRRSYQAYLVRQAQNRHFSFNRDL